MRTWLLMAMLLVSCGGPMRAPDGAMTVPPELVDGAPLWLGQSVDDLESAYDVVRCKETDIWETDEGGAHCHRRRIAHAWFDNVYFGTKYDSVENIGMLGNGNAERSGLDSLVAITTRHFGAPARRGRLGIDSALVWVPNTHMTAIVAWRRIDEPSPASRYFLTFQMCYSHPSPSRVLPPSMQLEAISPGERHRLEDNVGYAPGR